MPNPSAPNSAANAVAEAIAAQRAASAALLGALSTLLEPSGLVIASLCPSDDGWTIQVRTRPSEAQAGVSLAETTGAGDGAASETPLFELPLPGPAVHVPGKRLGFAQQGDALADPLDDGVQSSVPEPEPAGVRVPALLPLPELEVPDDSLPLPAPGRTAASEPPKASSRKSGKQSDKKPEAEARPASKPGAAATVLPEAVRPLAPDVTIADVGNMSSDVTEGYSVPTQGRKRENILRARETDPKIRAQQLARTLVGEILVYRRTEHMTALAAGLPEVRSVLGPDIERARQQFMHDVDANLGEERDAIFADAVNTLIGRGQTILPAP